LTRQVLFGHFKLKDKAAANPCVQVLAAPEHIAA
jgi:hypothetical protein